MEERAPDNLGLDQDTSRCPGGQETPCEKLLANLSASITQNTGFQCQAIDA